MFGEETEEFLKDDNLEEMTDILEIIEATANYRGFYKEEIESAKENKTRKAGGFKKRIIFEGD